MTLAIASVAGCASLGGGRARAAPSYADLFPNVTLRVGGGPGRLMVMANGRISPPDQYAFLTLSWPLPARRLDREVALALRAGVSEAMAAAAETALAAETISTRAPAARGPSVAAVPPPVIEPDDMGATAGPTIAEVQDATLRWSGLDPDETHSLERRARLAALLPQLGVSINRTVRREDSLVASELTGDHLDLLAGAGYAYEVHATWHLDRLVYDASELRVLAGSARLSGERAALLLQVTNLYYQREALLRGAAAGAADPARELAIARLGAEIDALCGGCLSGRGRDP